MPAISRAGPRPISAQIHEILGQIVLRLTDSCLSECPKLSYMQRRTFQNRFHPTMGCSRPRPGQIGSESRQALGFLGQSTISRALADQPTFPPVGLAAEVDRVL
jgi:hypothetical protein